MGRSPASKGNLADAPLLFEQEYLPEVVVRSESNFRSLEHPLWTEQKALLIREYLRLFTLVTKHGAYIDGFAAPQRRDLPELCSALQVLENRPAWIRYFWLCDVDRAGAATLERLVRRYRTSQRKIVVLPGDFNTTVDRILKSPRLTSKTATFALLDQRTFECDWNTVKKLAEYKQRLATTATKIEIFYFLATGWLDRSIAAAKTPATLGRLNRWWGREDWKTLRHIGGVHQALAVSERFRDELGYKHARPYPIHNKKRKGRTMYHMIHATDHDEAHTLMSRAYRKISGRSGEDISAKQTDMTSFWQ